MALKDWIRNVSEEVSKATSKAASKASPKATSKAGPRGGRERHSVSDLIALGRVEEAEERLRARLKKNRRDHHARLKLADLLFNTEGRRVDAVEEYMFVAEGYAADGFDDKAHALLTKLERLMPGEPKLTAKIARLDRDKEIDRRLAMAQEALLEERGGLTGPKAFTIQQATVKLAKCSLLEALTPEQIQRLFRKLDIVRFADHEALAKTGDSREELFILLSGEIAAEVQLPNGGRTTIRSFTSGQVIGEAALLSRQPWPVDYSVLRKVVALKLDRSALEAMLPGEPDPRRFLDALRSQNHDAEVAEAISGMNNITTSSTPEPQETAEVSEETAP